MSDVFAIMIITLVGLAGFLWGASRVTQQDRPLARAPWFLFRRVLDLIGVLFLLAVSKSFQSTANTNPMVVAAVLYGLAGATYGYALGVGGARRSFSIRGDTAMALLALVPLFNLYLLFAAPKIADEDDLSWAYIGGGVVALLMTYGLQGYITDSSQASSNVTAFLT